MTTSANLELVRSICSAWERGDFTSADWAHPDIEYVVVGGPSPGSWTGLAGMAEGFRDFLNAWEDFRFKPIEYREIDGERVLVPQGASGRGKACGMEFEQFSGGKEGANLFHIRDGGVTRLVFYTDRDSAFADLGLTPEGDAAPAD